MNITEWRKGKPLCKCVLVRKYGELLEAIKVNCKSCREDGSKDCGKCALFKFT